MLSDAFDFTVLIITEPLLYLTSVDQRVYWLYLLAAIVLAGWVFVRSPDFRDQTKPISRFRRFLQFFEFCFPKHLLRHRSTRTDCVFFIVNRMAFPWLIAPLMVGITGASQLTVGFLGQFSFLTDMLGKATTIDQIIFTLLLLFVMDGAIYFTHYMQHHFPPLWEFHKVHHSAEVLTPITVYRMHPVDDLLSGSIAGIAVGLVTGLFQTIYAEGIGWYSVAGLNLGVIVFYFFGYNLRHSHIWLSYPPLVSRFFISPAQHQIHHSMDPAHFGKNLGFIFAFWDWAAGTLYVPKTREPVKYGIIGTDSKDFNAVWKLYFLPFKGVARLLKVYKNRIEL